MVREHPAAHVREHSLEMQLPFVRRLAPRRRIVPLVMGWQTPATAVSSATRSRRAARAERAARREHRSSHYHDANTAARLDAVVIDHVARFDPEALQRALDGGPNMRAAAGRRSR